MPMIVFLSLLILGVLPMLVIALSKRVSGKTKVTWLLGAALFSWLAVIVFFMRTPKPSV